jgi:hypothetical protein
MVIGSSSILKCRVSPSSRYGKGVLLPLISLVGSRFGRDPRRNAYDERVQFGDLRSGGARSWPSSGVGDTRSDSVSLWSRLGAALVRCALLARRCFDECRAMGLCGSRVGPGPRLSNHIYSPNRRLCVLSQHQTTFSTGLVALLVDGRVTIH